ncbi:MAG: aminopeptidase [Gammaproteobacteria bacterium]|nr:aminopeptidase [Gammaproteobacteria bacterium]
MPVVKVARRLSWSMLAILALWVLTGCSTLQFYQQAALGQWQLMQARKPITAVLADVKREQSLRTQLELTQDILDFAETNLGLDREGRYQSYVDLQRPYVVWNVFASRPLDLEGHSWCYPFIGCAPYRGYFKHSAALEQAQQLRQQGYETYVGGVPAYSTLGWFEDPVLNTFVYWPSPELASLLIHELSHSRVWLDSDVAFNESFASFVGRQGAREWMRSQNGEAAWHLWQTTREDWRRFRAFLMRAKSALNEIYAQDGSEAERLHRKSLALDEIKQCYQVHKAVLGQGRWDKLINQDLNNAFLVSLATYEDWLPAFAQLFKQRSNDWATFFQAVEDIAALAPAARQAMMQTLSQQQETTYADHNYPEQIQCETFARHGANAETAS